MSLTLSPKKMQFLLNIYPPYLGAGIRVDSISTDWSEIKVSMKLRWYNRNSMGVHFGGSLCSMTDPQFVLMLTHQLGQGYIVWDQATEIEFVRQGIGKVSAVFQIKQEEVDSIKAATANGSKHHPAFTVTITDESDAVIAKVRKILYVIKT